MDAWPSWPGAEVAPSQPMFEQTRAVFDMYAANGGRYTELGWDECGHSAHREPSADREPPAEFLEVLGAHLAVC